MTTTRLNQRRTNNTVPYIYVCGQHAENVDYEIRKNGKSQGGHKRYNAQLGTAKAPHLNRLSGLRVFSCAAE